MEYRDQLKYIKSHQEERRPEKGQKRRKKKRPNQHRGRIGALDRILWFVQALATLFFLVSMALLGILPVVYMVGACVLLLLLLLVVRSMQRRAARSRKKKSSGKGLSFVVSVLLVVAGLYGLKVNAALDQIAIGDETGGYDEQHRNNKT